MSDHVHVSHFQGLVDFDVKLQLQSLVMSFLEVRANGHGLCPLFSFATS